MVVHHMGHSSDRSRGDSRLIDWPDATWKLIRHRTGKNNEVEDYASPRFFSAYGRDVDAKESELPYDGDSRTLTVAGGSRRNPSRS